MIIFSGVLASFMMYLVIYTGIYITGMAPFNVPPSAAFLHNLGIMSKGYALLLHFCYGTLWSYVLIIAFEEDTSFVKALILSVILWLFMMIVYSPLIGWGIFGFGNAHHLSASHPLYLTKGISYPLITLLLHLVYGSTLGYVTSRLKYKITGK